MRTGVLVPGMRYTYAVYWGKMRAGTAMLEIGPMKKFEGRKVYQLLARTRSDKLIKAIYPVQDQFESYIDTEKFLPLWYEEHKIHSGRRGHIYLDFNREKRWVKTWKWKKKQGKIMRRGLPMIMKGPTHDPLSVIFFCQRLKIEPGFKYHFDVAAGKKLYPMVLYVLGVEDLELKSLGKRKCLRVKPDYEFEGEGIFEKKGNVDLWVDAEWRVPAKLVVRIPTLLRITQEFTVELEKTEKVTVPIGEPEEIPKWTKEEKTKLAPEPGAAPPDENRPDKKSGGE